MSDQLFEHAVHDWLDDGSDRTPPTAIDAVLLAIQTTPQERDLRIPRRLTPMPNQLRLAAAIAIVAVLGAGAVLYINRGPDVGTINPPPPTPTIAPSAAPVPSPTINPLIDTTAWTSYTSAQYGFKVGHPDDWTVTPADRAWDLDTDAADWLSSAADSFSTAGAADGLGVRVSFWAVPFEYQATETWDEVETWFQTYCRKAGGTLCTELVDRAIQLCIEIRDCHPGILVGPPLQSDVQAFFSGGFYNGQMVVGSVWRTYNDPSVAPYGGGQKLLEAFLSTMCVWPTDARPAPGAPCLGADTPAAS
jgi:hypothetical protein